MWYSFARSVVRETPVKGKRKRCREPSVKMAKWDFLAAELCARGRLSMKIRNELFVHGVVLSRLALSLLYRNKCTPGLANNETQDDRQAYQDQ